MDDETTVNFLNAMAIEVGRLVIAWAMLEKELSKLASALLGLKIIQERALVRPLDARAKTDLLRHVIKAVAPGSYSTELKQLLNDIDNAREERNDIVHGEYVHDKNQKSHVIIYKGAKRVTGRPRRVTPESIHDLFERVASYSQTIREVNDELQYPSNPPREDQNPQ